MRIVSIEHQAKQSMSIHVIWSCLLKHTQHIGKWWIVHEDELSESDNKVNGWIEGQGDRSRWLRQEDIACKNGWCKVEM